MLRNLLLKVKLEKLLKWISELKNLAKLKLENSELTNDPMKSLKKYAKLVVPISQIKCLSWGELTFSRWMVSKSKRTTTSSRLTKEHWLL
ncbi:hypothetical protein MTR_5g065145 [Medicago truncatula]|uniref:Uncharacterized protein n=1 Tax=Medicago truncatula TaxID=3880 RepID=A0A072UEK3_MEDTR|nr:hypothetical protein MTR_5g065145 [Medicago truncatula]